MAGLALVFGGTALAAEAPQSAEPSSEHGADAQAQSEPGFLIENPDVGDLEGDTSGAEPAMPVVAAEELLLDEPVQSSEQSELSIEDSADPESSSGPVDEGKFGQADWSIEDGVLSIGPGKLDAGTRWPMLEDNAPWVLSAARGDIVKIQFTGPETTVLNKNSDRLFANLNSLKEFEGMELLDISGATSMEGMFSGAKSLKNLDALRDWNTVGVTNMKSMFSHTDSLTSIEALRDWNTGTVFNMENMFSYASKLESIEPLAGWDTGKVTNMSYMFANANSLASTKGLGSWDVSKVTNMSHMFIHAHALSDIEDLGRWGEKTAKVQTMAYMFGSTRLLTNVDPLASWNTGRVTNMEMMFMESAGLADIKGLRSWNVGWVTDMAHMFRGTLIDDITPLEEWNVVSVKEMQGLFRATPRLSDISPLEAWKDKTGKVQDMSGMFWGARALVSADPLGGWDTSSLTKTTNLFYDATALESVDLSAWNTSGVTKEDNAKDMFDNANLLRRITLGKTSALHDNVALVIPPVPESTGKWVLVDPLPTDPSVAWWSGSTSELLERSRDAQLATGIYEWQPPATVAFDLNEGEGSFEAINAGVGDLVSIPGTEPTRREHEFLGWSLVAASGPDSATDDALVSPGATFVTTGDVVMVAQWQVIEYRVAFDLNGAEGSIDPVFSVLDEVVVLPTPPQYAGHEFLAWLPVLPARTVSSQDLLPAGTDYTVTGDVLMVAQWKKVDSPEKPVEPVEPVEPVGPGQQGKPAESGKPQLPKMGGNSAGFLVGGLLMVVAGAGAVFLTTRRSA